MRIITGLAVFGIAVHIAASALATDTAGLAPQAAAAEVSTDGPVPAAMLEEGGRLFKANCRQCHGSKGTAGVPLKDNEKLADAYYVTSVILTGPGYMTGFAEHLDDGEIAAIASFVRSSWGNDYGSVTPQDVADMR